MSAPDLTPSDPVSQPVQSPGLPPTPSRNPNRVRDHLANERTFLAWIRTAVALMGFGVVIVRLRYLLPPGMQERTHGRELGLLFALVGLSTVLLSTFEYFAVRKAIETESYEPKGRWIILLSLAVSLIGAGILYYLLSTPITAAPGVP